MLLTIIRYISFRLLLVTSVLFISHIKAQDGRPRQTPDDLAWQFTVGDEWFNKRQGLEVGDKMPDISLGELSGSDLKIAKISDLKGKLIILDFWNTGCASCIAAFPKMEGLQKKFGDKIQILLVNPWETEGHIQKAFERRNHNRSPETKVKLPNLPSLTAERNLLTIFPMRFVPHHVWIDQNGMIALIGHGFNTHAEKIDALLKGSDISYLKGENITPRFNPLVPYHQILDKQIQSKQYNFIFSNFQPDYASVSGGVVRNAVDSVTAMTRNTWVNETVWDICLDAYPDFKNSSYNEIIYSPMMGNTAFSVKDTNLYTDQFIITKVQNKSYTDYEFMKCRICYEQLAPESFSANQLTLKMQRDLNGYLEKNLKSNVSIEKRPVSCWVLRKDNSGGHLGIDNTSSKNEGKNSFQITNQISNSFRNYLLRSGIIAKLAADLYYVVDKSVLEIETIDIFLPENPTEVKSISELNTLLRKYRLEFVKEDRELDFMVIKDITYEQ